MLNDGEMDMHKEQEGTALPVKLRREIADTIAEAAAVAADKALDETPDETGWRSTIEVVDEASILKGLTEGVRDQNDLEKDISSRANAALVEQEDERDEKRIKKVKGQREKLLSQQRLQVRRLATIANNPLQRRRIQIEIDRLDADISDFDNDIKDIQQRMNARHAVNEKNENIDYGEENRRRPNESQRDFLLRTGKITPFSSLPSAREGQGHAEGELEDALLDVEAEFDAEQNVDIGEPKSHQNLRLPGFMEEPESDSSAPAESEFQMRPRKKRRIHAGSGLSFEEVSDGYEDEPRTRKEPDVSTPISYATTDPDADFPDLEEDGEEDDDNEGVSDIDRSTKVKKTRKQGKIISPILDLTGVDDGDEKVYQRRLASWSERRGRARHNKQQKASEALGENGEGSATPEDAYEWFNPSPDAPDHQFDNGIKIPGDIYPSLFNYQKTGVQWLGELYQQQVGGIIGDEMGLGKTIQIISFIAALHYSKKLTKPVIIVAPATVLRQWVNEFHRWWPPLRVSILHSSGSGMLNTTVEDRAEENAGFYNGRNKGNKLPKGHKAAKRIVDRVLQHGHVLVTTYAGIQTYGDVLIPINWAYAVLDEGHKIRNPNTAITVYCKELQTSNRVILSGTPMQNNLIELWSLFDFVYPMRLGTLVNFRQQFEVPIKLGGYANATNLQILTATKCAETLKDTISPYLLQRFKVDVAADLPKKTEQVLFCKLTKPQREAYEVFLNSDDMTSILNRTRQSLFGIDILRKICNHPDLLDPKLRIKPGYKWGNPNKSGKMQVVRALLELWKKAGDKVLLFSQGVQMLNIIEDYVKGLDGVKYLRMDGGTPVKDRQTLVDRFNTDPSLDVFLLTTKVGGLGVNLTGANRVIIFDPDWNPSTDVQARERAWRLGQKKQVTIYRLMTAGTIEEKIYHRQIFKQFLADKILKDPKQRQTFHMKDLYDLFTLGDSEDGTTETGEMFKGTEVHQFGIAKEQASFTKPHAYGTEKPGPVLIAAPIDASEDTSGIPDVIPENTVDESEVRAITGVHGLEIYRGDPTEDKPSGEDARIMEGIFARSGVHSVLQHDQIINGKKKVQADRGMIEREAKRIAAEAADELRKAGEAARNIPIGTVTWTGEVGEGGRPAARGGRAGPSSFSILSSLSSRQGVASGSSSRSGTPGNGNSSSNETTGPRGKDFIKLIRNYIRQHGGSAPSQMLVVHFNPMTRTPQLVAEFKACLGEVALMKPAVGRGGRGRSRWELREEFK